MSPNIDMANVKEVSHNVFPWEAMGSDQTEHCMWSPPSQEPCDGALLSPFLFCLPSSFISFFVLTEWLLAGRPVKWVIDGTCPLGKQEQSCKQEPVEPEVGRSYCLLCECVRQRENGV